MAENNHVHFSHDVLARENSKVSAIDWRKLTVAEKEAELESVWSDEAYGVEERDFKKKQVCVSWNIHGPYCHNNLIESRYLKAGHYCGMLAIYCQ